MHLYPEEVRDRESKRKLRKMRYVVYDCGCKLFNVLIVPHQCDLHKKGVKTTGPMMTPEGDPYFINPRHIC